MANQKDPKQYAKEIEVVVQDALTSIADRIGNAIEESMGTVKDVSDSTLKDISSGFRDLSKVGTELSRSMLQASQGELSRAKVNKIILDRKTKEKALEKSIEIARRNGVGNVQQLEKSLKEVQGYNAEIEASLKEQADYSANINKSFGLSGDILSSVSKFAGKLGLSNLSEEFQNINTTLKTEIGQEIEKNGGKALGFGKKFQFAGKAIGQTAKVLGKGMMDPLFIVGKIFNSFLDLNKAAVDLSRQVGRSNVSFNNVNGSLATTTELLKTAAEFTRQTGLAATSVFTNSQLANIAESTKLLGLSADQANNLATFSKTTGSSISQFEDGLVDGINAANKFGKSAVAPGVALQDALSASQGVALSLGNNPKLLGKAATAARALGLELAKVDNIAEGLLNFESSIQNELEAQLLTGKNINLAKAREFALNNDLAGLSAELAKNGASAAEFANMNRIQQNALAQALGMSRDELAKTIIQQDIQGNLTEEQKAKVLGITTEQLKQQSIQQSINDSITKMTETLAGPLAFMAQLASHSAVLYTTLGGIATLLSVNMAAGFIKNIKYLSRILSISKTTAAVEASIASIKALSNPILAVAGLAAAATVGGAAGYYLGKAQQTGDLAINPNGGPVVMSPREGGLYQGTRNDALMMAPPGAMGGNNAELLAEIKALRAAVERGGNVYMDGNKVGEALVLSTYKSS